MRFSTFRAAISKLLLAHTAAAQSVDTTRHASVPAEYGRMLDQGGVNADPMGGGAILTWTK